MIDDNYVIRLLSFQLDNDWKSPTAFKEECFKVSGDLSNVVLFDEESILAGTTGHRYFTIDLKSKRFKLFKGHKAEITCLDVTKHKGDFIAVTGCRDGTLIIRDAHTGHKYAEKVNN